MVTINDIAKKCGFSASTVSRALANVELIPLETRTKIQQMAEGMGYVPNLAAKSLKTRKAWNIGVISFIDANQGLSHYLFMNILDNFVKVLEVENYDVTLLSSKLLLDDGDLVGHCRARNLDGVLILCADTSVKQIKNLINSDIPTVSIDNFEENITDNMHCVTSDNRRKMFDMTDYIISMGHKNIVYITGQDIFVTRERIKGFKSALEINHIDFQNDMLVASAYYSLDDGTKKVNEVLDRKNTPTCIIVQDDYVAMKASNILRDRGLVVGKDISIAGFDGLEISQEISPKITTVKQDTVSMGREAARILLDVINKKSADFIKVVSATLLKGESIAKL